MLLIKNGRVLDPASGTDAALDILLDGDTIARIAEPAGARDRNEVPKAQDAPRKLGSREGRRIRLPPA